MRMVSTLDILSFGDVTQELRTACDNLVRFRIAGDRRLRDGLGQRCDPARDPPPRGLLLHEVVRMKPEEVLVAMTAGPIAVDGPADLIVLGRTRWCGSRRSATSAPSFGRVGWSRASTHRAAGVMGSRAVRSR